MPFEPGTIAVIILTLLVSWQAFLRRDLLERLLFSTDAILRGRQWERVATSGLVHADWGHLLLNMFSFYFFAGGIERRYGTGPMLLIYASGIAGGGLLSLWLHRHHAYRALGASGGVCGIIFASIFMVPGGSVVVFPLPIGIPAWLYAILFLAGTYYEMRRQRDHVGHDAHLGGALIGLLTATALYPQIIRVSPVLYAAVLVLTLLMFLHLLRNPLHLPWALGRGREPAAHPRYSTRHLEEDREVDRLLDQVARQGMDSLTDKERALLDRYSQRLKGRE